MLQSDWSLDLEPHLKADEVLLMFFLVTKIFSKYYVDFPMADVAKIADVMTEPPKISYDD